MDQSLTLSEESILHLKCGWCNGVLSVPPICLSKGKFTCGRCTAHGLRIPIYEELAKSMLFPCLYEECTAKLPWGKTRIHEKHCPHKTTLCPVYKCQRTYELRRIHAHFEKFHKQFILPNPAKASKKLEDNSVKNFRSDNKVFLTVYENITFLIFVDSVCVFGRPNKDRITAYNYSFGIFATKPEVAGDYKYEVRLDLTSDDGGTFTQILKDQQVLTFNENLHCHECLNGTCHLKNHKHSKDFLATKFPNLPSHKRTRLTYTVRVYGNATRGGARLTDCPKAEGLTSKLECPICKDYMCAPIYNCNKGHTLCGDCKNQVKECPFCKAEMGKSRNFILEEIAESVRLPCDNAGRGCKFVGLVRAIKDHEKHCSFNK